MANKQMTGCIATATACKLADVDVICSYPIRPYTGIMSELARMVADGELDAEFAVTPTKIDCTGKKASVVVHSNKAAGVLDVQFSKKR